MDALTDKMLQISDNQSELNKQKDEIIDAIIQEAIKQGNKSMAERYFGSELVR
jgi:hypothetical protein